MVEALARRPFAHRDRARRPSCRSPARPSRSTSPPCAARGSSPPSGPGARPATRSTPRRSTMSRSGSPRSAASGTRGFAGSKRTLDGLSRDRRLPSSFDGPLRAHPPHARDRGAGRRGDADPAPVCDQRARAPPLRARGRPARSASRGRPPARSRSAPERWRRSPRGSSTAAALRMLVPIALVPCGSSPSSLIADRPHPASRPPVMVAVAALVGASYPPTAGAVLRAR